MEEFVTNPYEWSIEGNIIGEELGSLDSLTNWTGTHATVNQSSVRTINGLNIQFVAVTYSGS